MRKLIIITVLFLMIASLSCSSVRPLSSWTKQTQANRLSQYCLDRNIQSSYTSRGARHIYDANESLANDDEEAAGLKFELAILSYQVAISEQELTQSYKELGQAESKLSEAETKLRTYKSYLKSLKLPIMESNF